MQAYRFNINNYVKAKLHEEGYEHWKRFCDATYEHWPQLHQYIKPIEYYKEKADEEGYVRFQAWEFMRIFGSSISMGRRNVFETDIVIDEKYLTPIE